MGIRLDATQVVAVAAFLRVVNALENVRAGIERLGASRGFFEQGGQAAPPAGMRDTEDAIEVLARAAGPHPPAVAHLKEDRCLNQTASSKPLSRAPPHPRDDARPAARPGGADRGHRALKVGRRVEARFQEAGPGQALEWIKVEVQSP